MLASPSSQFTFTLSLVNLVLVSVLLYTLLAVLPRHNAPRHPVIVALLVLTIPTTLILLLPSLFEQSLAASLPPGVTTPSTAWAAFCLFQNLSGSYLLALHAAYIVSFTLSLLQILNYPWQSQHCFTFTSSVSTPASARRFMQLIIIAPVLFLVPLPVLGLALVLTSSSRQGIVVFQHNTCVIDAFPYRLTASLLTAVPLVIALGITLYIVCCMARGYANENGIYCPITRAVRKYLRERRERRATAGDDDILVGEKSSSQSDVALNLPITLCLRILLLLTIILVSTILVLLQAAFYQSPSKLKTIMLIDHYWEAIVPTLEFVIFATQSRVLECWFPQWSVSQMDASAASSDMAIERDEWSLTSCQPNQSTRGRARPAWSLGVIAQKTNSNRKIARALHGLRIEGKVKPMEAALDSRCPSPHHKAMSKCSIELSPTQGPFSITVFSEPGSRTTSTEGRNTPSSPLDASRFGQIGPALTSEVNFRPSLDHDLRLWGREDPEFGGHSPTESQRTARTARSGASREALCNTRETGNPEELVFGSHLQPLPKAKVKQPER